VDFDRVCVTNVNRQIHALKGTLGKSKVAVMAERLLQVNPDMRVETRNEFYSERTSARLLSPEPDVIVDAIDNVTAKIHLLATAVRERLRIVTAMGAAARMDPTRVKTADLMLTSGCGLAREVRSLLRKNYGIGEPNKAMGVTAVYSDEPAIAPVPLGYDNGGFECVCPSGDNGLHDCDSRMVINGSSPFVPSVFGMAAASVAVRMITGTFAG
jgi:tRNA A37 threonylcarbamoyladenosine dehydratase